MANRSNPQKMIEDYKRRQKMTPYVIGGLAALLVIAGVVILVLALNASQAANTPTPTPQATAVPPTNTVAPTATLPLTTPTMTNTFTITPTSTATITPTATGPFEYTVLEKDNCWDIAAKFKVDINVLLAINNFPAGQCPINPGQKIMIPAAGQILPTSTPVDISRMAPGTLFEYVVQPGDTLRAIALTFNSTMNAIMAQNKMADANKLVLGQKLIIPVNIATPVPTTTDTPTPKPGTPSATPPAPSQTPTVTATK